VSGDRRSVGGVVGLIEAVPMRWPSVELSAETAQGPRRVETSELERARQQGRAEGLAETQALRDQLAALCRSLAAQRQDIVEELAGAVVDAALVVIEAWLEASDADRQARLAPVVSRWVRDVGAEIAAVAQVSPGDVAALRAVVAELPIELPIEVRADPQLSPGDIRLRCEHALIELRWRDRLGELRETLIAMMAVTAATETQRGSHAPSAAAEPQRPASPA
jgi:flagellar biosynthesis/type III secretory pathway protein FliH